MGRMIRILSRCGFILLSRRRQSAGPTEIGRFDRRRTSTAGSLSPPGGARVGRAEELLKIFPFSHYGAWSPIMGGGVAGAGATASGFGKR